MRFVDSNVFVYHLAGDKRYGGTASRILEKIEEGEEAVTSTLVIAQVCSYLRWKGRYDVIPRFLDYLLSTPEITKGETSLLDFANARSLRRLTELPWKDWDDLVIASQMRRFGLSEIYSNDSDYDNIPGITRVFRA